MLLNKFAGWGIEPIDRVRPPGLGAVTRVGLGAINTTLEKTLPDPSPMVKTPSATGLRIVWSLNAVRDALSDQNCASVDDTNDQIANRHASNSVAEIGVFLEQCHPDLVGPYELQFRRLEADSDDAAAFDLERRERLAELATFELLVMASVGERPHQTTAAAAPAARRTGKRR
jgi:hypothetical protein